MKAVLINNNGFRKYIELQKKTDLVSLFNNDHVNVRPLSKELLENMAVPITTYEFVREYFDEFDNIVLIYREIP